ncbi:receptor-type tyrosine-protein phosphatase alpha-like [Babylonia areolata]|uniref:receptor-type tyrosine-protein phosphatase alpha-like n=1 Tax=Babylonia areolata TaxID=304850 RepID=UPI003FD5433A
MLSVCKVLDRAGEWLRYSLQLSGWTSCDQWTGVCPRGKEIPTTTTTTTTTTSRMDPRTSETRWSSTTAATGLPTSALVSVTDTTATGQGVTDGDTTHQPLTTQDSLTSSSVPPRLTTDKVTSQPSTLGEMTATSVLSTPEETTSTPETTVTPEETTGTPEETTGTPEETTGTPEETTGTSKLSTPAETTATSEPSTHKETAATSKPFTPEETTGTPEETTGTPEETTAMSEPSTREETTATSKPFTREETTGTPEETTGTPEETTGTPEETTGTSKLSTPAETTATSEPSTHKETAATSKPFTPEETTGTPEETTAMSEPSTREETTATSKPFTREETAGTPTLTTNPAESSVPSAEPTPTLKGRGGFGNQQTHEGGSSRNSNGQGGDSGGGMTGVWAAVGVMVVVVALAAVAGIVYKRTHVPKPNRDQTACVVDMEMNDLTPSESKDDEENEYGNAEPFTVTTEAIPLDAFRNHLSHMKRVGGYSKEFKELPHGMHRPVSAAEEVNNGSVKKNRFKDISPYDESRVMLKKEEDLDSDYINASYISGFVEVMAYIAAQGPLPETVGDFWHMVWTEGCSKIVMLTNLVEGNKIKCERYWPEGEGTIQIFGRYKVTLVKVVQKAHFVHRLLSIVKLAGQSMGGGGAVAREVHQFHFTAWPDHGVPCPVALVRFWACVVLQPIRFGGPMLVHCSAGIGRTGTFIALDMLTHQADTTGKVSVFPTVRRLRNQRVNMVQTLSQYKFLHEVVQEWLSSREGDIIKDDLQHGSRWKVEEGETLPAAVRQQCAAQYQSLKDLQPALKDKDTTTAGKENNAGKNRSPQILPVEQFRVCLAKTGEEDSDYINAVFLPSVSRELGYIVTQLPLANTVGDFWAMVRDWGVRTVVRFMDAPKDQEVSLYPDKEQSVQYGTLSVHTQSKEVFLPGVSRHTITLQDQADEGGQQVSVYCVESQQALCLKATKVFVSLMDVLLPKVMPPDQPPIVLQCFTGADLSCVLCAVMMAVESLLEEGRTSPFLTARLIHTARPHAFSTPEQYEFITRCLLHDARKITEKGDADNSTAGEQSASTSTDADNVYNNVESDNVYNNV